MGIPIRDSDVMSNISNTRQRVSSHFQTRRRELKVRIAASIFDEIRGVFLNVMKHSLECSIYLFSIETKATEKRPGGGGGIPENFG